MRRLISACRVNNASTFALTRFTVSETALAPTGDDFCRVTGIVASLKVLTLLPRAWLDTQGPVPRFQGPTAARGRVVSAAHQSA